MQHSKHVFRALILIVFWALVFLVVRGFAIPSSFGKYGHFRGNNVAEQMTKALVYGAPDSCVSCHTKQAETVHKGKHTTVPCQDCHAPLSVHSDGKKKTAPMPVNRSVRLCERCHQKLEARPQSFSQVVPAEHLQQVGGEDGPEACVGCHTPHDPKI